MIANFTLKNTVLIASLISWFPLSSASAQITTDGTTSTTVTPNGNNFTIEQGDRAGGNLFHSFQEFSVPNGGEAFFNNAVEVNNIFSRVTGGNLSNIDGLIRANGSANLFLINPAGILFGEGARLNIGGSFYGSTADSILFSNGEEFSAIDPDNPPLLTINAPIGLNFRDNPNPIITNNTEDLSNSNLNLIGGDININSRLFGTEITLGGLSSSGIVSITAEGDLVFPEAITKANISLDNNAFLGVFSSNGSINLQGNNISLNNGSLVIAGAENDVNIQADNSILIDNNSSIIAQVTDDQGRNAGDINLNATQISLDNSSSVINQVGNQDISNAVGNSGDISINIDSLALNNASSIIAETRGIGDVGDININANNSISVLENSFIQNIVKSGAVGNAGDVNLNVAQTITFNDSNLSNQVEIDAIGDAGGINVNTVSLFLRDGTNITNSNFGSGNGGEIIINALEEVTLENDIERPETEDFSINTSRIFSGVAGDSESQGARLEINTRNFTMSDRSFILANTQGPGNAGDVVINASEKITFTGTSEIFTTVEASATGNGGDITFNTKILEINDGSIFSFVRGQGNAGNIIVNALESVTIDASNDPDFATTQLNVQVQETGIGNAGSIEINTGNLSVDGGAFILADTKGRGNSGDIIVNATENITLDGSSRIIAQVGDNTQGNAGNIAITADNIFLNNSNIQAQIGEGAEGNAGNIDIITNSLLLQNNALILSDTKGKGNSGNTAINATERVFLDNSDIISGVGFGGVTIPAQGEGGDVVINTNSLSLQNNSQILANIANGVGIAGNIVIDATDNVVLNNSDLQAKIEEQGAGTAGNVEITTNDLSLQNGAIILSDTQGKGNAGNTTITATNTVFLDNSEIVTGVGLGGIETQAEGNGGDVVIKTNSLFVQNNSQILANITNGKGIAGNVTLNAVDSVVINNSDIEAQVEEIANGDAGDINIITNSFTATNGTQITTATAGQGNAGSININANDSIILDGLSTTIISEVLLGATGNAGGVKITTNSLEVSDGVAISASAFGEGNAGNVTVNADSVLLNNNSSINAQTKLGEGGNITLNVIDDLILRNNSFISARALEDADGGNLNIDARFIIAFPSKGNGNDIIATAERGDGGNITFNTNQIFNLQEGDAIDNENNFISNNTNDIDASSDFGLNGEISINNPDVNPFRGATELPRNPVSADVVANDVCSANGNLESQNSFIITGKGGIPPVPTDPFIAESLLTDNESIQPNISQNNNLEVIQGSSLQETNAKIDPNYIPEYIKPIETDRGNIYIARGIVKTNDGKVILTPYPTSNDNSRNANNLLGCH